MSTATSKTSSYGRIFAVLLFGTFAFAIQETLVAPALPAIKQELDVSTTTVAFVLTAFLITAAIATPIAGRLGDMHGKERMLRYSLVVFGIGSLLCALSTSVELLIAGRAIQGVASGVFPLAFGVIRDHFPAEKVAFGIGVVSAVFGIGSGAALILSGVIIDHFPYQFLFWFALVPIVVGAVTAYLWLPAPAVTSPGRVDWVGAGLLSVATVALLVAISEGNNHGWASPLILSLLGVAAGVFCAWVAYERRHPDPLVDMKLMRERAMAATNATGLLVSAGMLSSFILIPLVVQMPKSTGYGFGKTVIDAGLFMSPATLTMLAAAVSTGWFSARWGSRMPLLLGTALACASFVLLAASHDNVPSILASSALIGAGIGFAFSAMANVIVEAVHPTRTGIATAVNTLMRQIGGAIGGQAIAAIIAGFVAAGGYPSDTGITLAFAASAVALALAFVVTLAIPRQLPYAPTRQEDEGGGEPRPQAA